MSIENIKADQISDIRKEQNLNLSQKIIRNYTDLKVYQLGFLSAMKLFEVSAIWPAEERYALTNQIRCSSRSVCGNIAEAWRKRRYPAHFVSKLSDADAESAETTVWLDFALACSYISTRDHYNLLQNYDEICRMLYRMMKRPNDWILKT